MKFKVGEEGPEGIAIDDIREFDNERVIEPDLGPTEGAREDDSEGGSVGARAGGCCRIRLRPLTPKPCSWSVIIGDLDIVSKSAAEDPASKLNRIRPFASALGT